MKNSIGNQLSITVFGESHGAAIGVVMDGVAPGIALDMDFINAQMDKRKAKGRISTQRKEADAIRIVSGYFNGYTTGSPLTILIENTNTRSKDYEKTKNRLRPSHADYTADMKYLGYQDYRGGGHFSGRLTAPIVAAGAIALQVLAAKGITIASHIQKCNKVEEAAFSTEEERLEKEMMLVNSREFPVIDEEKGKAMISLIEEAAGNGDSVGGILESVILHMPAGIGEPMFDSLESHLSQYLFSVPAVKGVEFGSGFGFADLYGSEANDALYYDQAVKTRTNHNGGINGGISNAMPIRIRTVIKPTPSIYKEQETIDRETHEAVKLTIEGRHDPAIIHRARVVVDSVIALALLDMIMEHEATMAMK